MRKQRKELVESCIALPISLFAEGVLNDGCFTINGTNRALEVGYALSQNDILTISFDGKEQCLEIQKMPVFRGIKTFFICGCGKRCKNLYLRQDGELFGCRVCNDLTYCSTRIDRDTANGKIFSDFARLTRIMDRREALQSIFYRGHPTKKFQKLLNDAERYGFHEFVSWQRNGISDLQDMKKMVEVAKNG